MTKSGGMMKNNNRTDRRTSGTVKVPGREKTTVKNKSGICPVADKCGGCSWINQPYADQLKKKEKQLGELLAPFCKIEGVIPMEHPEHYRNKVHAVFGENRYHDAISGIYEQKSHRIVPVDSCLIENAKADEIIVSIRGLLKSFHIRPYNEDTGYGLLRHVLIRTGHVTGQMPLLFFTVVFSRLCPTVVRFSLPVIILGVPAALIFPVTLVFPVPVTAPDVLLSFLLSFFIIPPDFI